jgi:hypothetical protein
MRKDKIVKLEWSRLLGFDQAVNVDAGDAAKLNDPQMVKLGSKSGTKAGTKST